MKSLVSALETPTSPTSRRRWLIAWIPFLSLAACASQQTSALKWTPAGKTRKLTGFSKVLVPDFADRVSEKYDRSPLDRREQKRAEMKSAVGSIADALAAALRETGAFTEVLRSGPPDAQTLVLAGTLWRYDDGDATARLYTRSRAGNTQVEARVELKDGASGASLATLIAENSSSGVDRTLRPSEDLMGAAQRVAEKIAGTVSAAARS